MSQIVGRRRVVAATITAVLSMVLLVATTSGASSVAADATQTAESPPAKEVIRDGVVALGSCYGAACEGKGVLSTGCGFGSGQGGTVVRSAYATDKWGNRMIAELRRSASCKSFWGRGKAFSFHDGRIHVERHYPQETLHYTNSWVVPAASWDWTLMAGGVTGHYYRAIMQEFATGWPGAVRYTSFYKEPCTTNPCPVMVDAD